MNQSVADPAGPRQDDLLSRFLPAIRQRFKAEVNRLTGGAMAGLLAGQADAEDLAFPLAYLCAFHWLRENVHADYRTPVLAGFRGRPERAALMDLLQHAEDAEGFLRGYVDYWLAAPANAPVQRDQLLALLARRGGDPEALVRYMLRQWESLGLFSLRRTEAYAELARQERERYRGMLSGPDQERLALVDALPARGATERFAKLGVIPAMGCPQTCRHSMFIWRPPMRDTQDTAGLYRLVDGLTDSVLFTGGDLTRHLEHFHRAIRSALGLPGETIEFERPVERVRLARK